MDERLKYACGYGPGWYRRHGKDGVQEYNPYVSEKQATMKYFIDRKPPGLFFPHIDNPHVVAVLYTYKDCGDLKIQHKAKFAYKKYDGMFSACAAAAKWIEEKINTKCGYPLQGDLFPGMGMEVI